MPKPLRNRLLLYALLATFILVYKLMSDNGLSIPCLFLTFFDTPCISCGATRAFYAMLKLDFRGAFAINPLFTAFVYPAFALYLIIDLVRVLMRIFRKK